jgi:hypothetical protein
VWEVNFLSNESEQVLTTTSGEGETSFMVCKTAEANKNQKVCVDVGNRASNTSNRAMTEKGMLDNNTYNLMEQLVVENRSLWRIKNNYKNDSVKDEENIQLWSTIEQAKQDIVELLTEKLRERL